MGGINLNINNVQNVEPTRSILNLLKEFQEKEYQGKKGLAQKHFRYALMENDGDLCYSGNLENFFDVKLNILINAGRIQKGCIIRRQQLNHFLGRLEEMGAIGSREKKTKKTTRYFIGENLLKSEKKEINKKTIDYYLLDQIELLKEIKTDSNLILFGIPNWLFEKEKQAIVGGIDKIEEEFKKIEDIVIPKLNNIRNKKIQEFLNKTPSKRIEKLLHEQAANLWKFFDITISDKLFYEVCKKLESYYPDMSKGFSHRFKSYVLNSLNLRRASSLLVISKRLHKWLLEFFGESKEDQIFYSQLWNDVCLPKNYNLSFQEIKDLMDFLEDSIFHSPTAKSFGFSRF